MSDTVPDTTEAFYVRETISDSASEQAPYGAIYGPFSEDGAKQQAADLETRFHDREAARTNPEGAAPVPSTREQGLSILTSDDFAALVAEQQHQDAPAPAAEPEPEPEAPAKSAKADPAAKTADESTEDAAAASEPTA